MKHLNKWKRSGVLLLTAAAVGSGFGIPGGEIKTWAAVAVQASPVTEYDEETLARFQDNTLEYWEISGLVERYNSDFLKQLDQFYYNPGSSTGLTREQLLSVAETLRSEAESLNDTAEEDKENLSKEEYQEYKSNVRILRARAKDLEDAAKGRSASGAAALRALRISKNQLIKTASQQMREYQTLETESLAADKALEIAELSYETAKRQLELGLYSAEDVLSAEEGLNSARSAAADAKNELTGQRQKLIKMLGWQYDAEPQIMKVPEPDTAKIAGYDPAVDQAKAIENNITLYETRMTGSAAQGGANQKARTIKDQENEVRTNLELLYRDVLQKQASYEAAKIKYTTDEAAKASADRKNSLGMLSRQEYLTAENAWLSAQSEFEAAGLSLTAAMEEYEWAVKGLMELAAAQQGA